MASILLNRCFPLDKVNNFINVGQPHIEAMRLPLSATFQLFLEYHYLIVTILVIKIIINF